MSIVICMGCGRRKGDTISLNGNVKQFTTQFGAAVMFSGRMPADTDQDGQLTIRELKDYLNSHTHFQNPQYLYSDADEVLFTRDHKPDY